MKLIYVYGDNRKNIADEIVSYMRPNAIIRYVNEHTEQSIQEAKDIIENDDADYLFVICEQENVIRFGQVLEFETDHHVIVHLVDTSSVSVEYETKRLLYEWYHVKIVDCKYIAKHIV